MPTGLPSNAVAQAHVANLAVSIRPIETYFKLACGFIGTIIVIFSLSRSGLGTDGSLKAFMAAASVPFALLMCSTMIGLLLGFLFGIPRSVQRAGAASEKDGVVTVTEQAPPGDLRRRPGPAFITNTNLEEISDWLTKIIIGLSLIQFKEIVAFIVSAAEHAAAFMEARGLAQPYDGIAPVPFLISLILTGLFGGFLFSYLQTRVRLTLLFITAQHVIERGLEEEEAGALLESSRRSITEAEEVATPRKAARASPPAPADERLVKIGRSEITDPRELVGWASAQARVGNLVVAEDALRDALQRDPDNTDIYLRLADVRRLRHNHAGAVEIIQEGVRKAGTMEARVQLLHRAILTSLYLPPPHGFRQAIELSDDFMKIAHAPDASVLLWRAAAFGQSYKWSKKRSDDDAAGEARSKAIEAIRRLVELRPNPAAAERLLLKAMLYPSPEERAAGEDDLAVFDDDEAIIALVRGD